MKVEKLFTRRRYIVKAKEMKEFFKLRGTIVNFGLWKGRSPQAVKDGVDPDTYDEFYIETEDEE